MSDSDTGAYSILQQPWWWDATALRGWQEASVKIDGRVVARWPFVLVHPAPGVTVLSSPPLTNRAGPWVASAEGKNYTRYARTGELLQKLLDDLPRSMWMVQNTHPELDYWLPLFWNGFQIEARISYVMDLHPESSPESLEGGMNEAARRQIRKARRNLGIEEVGPGKLIDLIRKTFERQRKGMRVSPAVLESVMEAIATRHAGRAIAAVDASGRAHAAALFVWDSTRMYYLVGGGDPALRSSGAGTYVLWDGICDAARRGLRFDFEGSMMPNIERFFRGFGASPSQYLSVTRGSALVRLAWSTVKALRK